MDKYRFREWCTNAGIIEGLSAAPTKGDIVDAIFDAGAAMSDRLVPWSNRTLYIPNEYFKLLALSDQFISIEALGKKSVSKGEVGEIDNMVVKRVPASYLPAGVYFLVKYKGSTVDPVKLNDMKIHQDPPGIGGNLLEGRIYHDSFVLGTKANGLYVAGASGSVTAAPTIKDTTGTVTITKKGTCKYTVDGTEPPLFRYGAGILQHLQRGEGRCGQGRGCGDRQVPLRGGQLHRGRRRRLSRKGPGGASTPPDCQQRGGRTAWQRPPNGFLKRP